MAAISYHGPAGNALKAVDTESTTALKEPTYGQIIKSSALIGGASAVNIIIGMIRTKVVALLLGPSGFGLMGLYISLTDLAQAVCGMGVSNSGVREIAGAVGSGDKARIEYTANVLRRVSTGLGIIGALSFALFSIPISVMTFGNRTHAASISLLSLSVLFRLISAGQSALVQGMRRISDIAMIGTVTALVGTIITIPLVFAFGEQGIVPSLLSITAVTAAVSWWYTKKLNIPIVSLPWSQFWNQSADLFKLGFAFMASSLMMMGGAYAIRMILLRKIGIEAAGLYGSAWTLGGLYVGFILQAMGTDFYPRLAGAIKDREECTRIVNEQTQVSLLMAGPGILATLTFSPLVVGLFYSFKFSAAIPILRWICLGMALRIITWPMGYIIIAKGAKKLFFLAEAAYTAVHLSLAWIWIGKFGMDGAGMAFCASYVFHGILVYPIVRHINGFSWSKENQRLGLSFVIGMSLVFGSFYWCSFTVATVFGTCVTLLNAFFSFQKLITLIGSLKIPAPVRKILVILKLAKSVAV
jgi:antigen flippase